MKCRNVCQVLISLEARQKQWRSVDLHEFQCTKPSSIAERVLFSCSQSHNFSLFLYLCVTWTKYHLPKKKSNNSRRKWIGFDVCDTESNKQFVPDWVRIKCVVFISFPPFCCHFYAGLNGGNHFKCCISSVHKCHSNLFSFGSLDH